MDVNEELKLLCKSTKKSGPGWGQVWSGIGGRGWGWGWSSGRGLVGSKVGGRGDVGHWGVNQE